MRDHLKERNTKENIKSLILVVLFLSTILLLYGYWSDTGKDRLSIDDLRNPENSINEIEGSEIIIPDALELSYGDGSYGLAREDIKKIWYDQKRENKGEVTFVSALESFFANRDFYVEEISKDQYIQITEMESVKAVFDWSLPFSLIGKTYNFQYPKALETLVVEEIAYSFASMESLFLKLEQGNSYIRIVGPSIDPITSPFYSLYERIGLQLEPAYPLSLLLGEDSANILVPMPSQILYYLYTFGKENKDNKDDKNGKNVKNSGFEKLFAKTFFGDMFDFTRIIEDAGGSTSYMYGYGRRVLIAESDGSFIYKSEESTGKTADINESLKIALAFIARHGGATNSAEEEYGLRLYRVKALDGGNQALTFYFSLLDPREIGYKAGEALAVTVSGNYVTEYKRDFFIAEKTQASYLPSSDYTAINVLAANYKEMFVSLREEGFLGEDYKEAEEEELALISKKISSIRIKEIRFLKNDEGLGKIESCWVFTFKDKGRQMEMYYSIKDAMPMGKRID